MLRVLALPAMLFALAPFHSSITAPPAPVQTQLKAGGFWHRGCPVSLSDLRLLTVSQRGFDRRVHTGQIVVNKDAARPLAGVFRRLLQAAFPDPSHAPRRRIWAETQPPSRR